MTWDERDLLPLSGLQHLVFCERQAALIHLEGLWLDNAATVDGAHRHGAVHEHAPRRERRGGVLIVRGLPLRSLELGIAGVADVVEFRRAPARASPGSAELSVRLPGVQGRWIPYPVEYKRGRPKEHRADEVQLCAQAMCLEEMLHCRIADGALFYGKQQRRLRVVFDEGLRELVRTVARRFHQLIASGQTPGPPDDDDRCRSCSLAPLCLPALGGRRTGAKGYIEQAVAGMLKSSEEGG